MLYIHTYITLHSITLLYITYISQHIHTYITYTTYIYTYIHAYIHTYMHAYIHTCIHAYMHPCIHAYMHTCIHAYMHTCIHAYMHTDILAYRHTDIQTDIHIHSYRHTYKHTNIQTYIHTYTHIHTHTYIHTYINTYVHTYLRTYTYIRTYVRTYIHIYVHICINMWGFVIICHDERLSYGYNPYLYLFIFILLHAKCVWFYLYLFYYPMVEGSLEVKLPTIWTDEKQSRDEAERREEKKKEDQKRESLRRKKIQVRETVGKSRNTLFFPMICGSGGSKSRLAKATGAEPAGQMRDEKCTPLWREAHFEVKMYKTHQCRTTFGSWDVEKVHAVVARSTFPSQNVQNTSAPDHFWKLRCRKSARRCGAKHILKSKCTKNIRFGSLLEVEMSKKCTPLWREAHFQVKMYKAHQVRITFGSWDVEKVNAVVAWSTFSKSKCTKHHMFAPLLEVRMLKKCTPLWREAHFEVKMYKTLGVRTTFGGSDVASPLRFTTLHYTTLHYTTLHYTTPHYTTLHSTTLQLQLHNLTTLHYTPLH